MDARITKSRLGNLLSYDWLKIIIAIVVAVLALSVIFTMIAPRAKDTQTFTIYAYADLGAGADSQTIDSDLLSKNVFSYEIVKTASEKFTDESGLSGLYQGAIYNTRLTNSARTVMFVQAVEEIDSEGYNAVNLLLNVNNPADGFEEHGFLNFETYLADCAEYLNKFFDDYVTGTLDKTRAEDCFYARNGNDRRFRSAEKKAAGVQSEIERLEKLRNDYCTVLNAFEQETLSYSFITVDAEHVDEQYGIQEGVYNCGVSLGKLTNLRKLYYGVEEGENGSIPTAEKLSLILFNTATLADKSNDLRYETISFLSYLLETYGD